MSKVIVYTAEYPLIGCQDTDSLGIFSSFELALAAIDAEVGEEIGVGVWYSPEPGEGKPYRFPKGFGIIEFPVHNYETATITKREVQTSLPKQFNATE